MHCVVTAGPTFEPLDDVRRLTNFSTGRLGSELVNYLAARGHQVTLLIGRQATWRGERNASKVVTFTTTADLRSDFEELAGSQVDAVFHAAAVSDFSIGKVWARSPGGEMTEVRGRKFSTRHGTLLAELVPTPKLIGQMRGWFPKARLVGWKYEVDGRRPEVLELGRKQLRECLTDGCVVNGPAYGPGFGLITAAGNVEHCPEMQRLFQSLEQLAGA